MWFGHLRFRSNFSKTLLSLAVCLIACWGILCASGDTVTVAQDPFKPSSLINDPITQLWIDTGHWTRDISEGTNIVLITGISGNHNISCVRLVLEGQGHNLLCQPQQNCSVKGLMHPTAVTGSQSLPKQKQWRTIHSWIVEFCNHRSPSDLFERSQGILKSLKIETSVDGMLAELGWLQGR